MKIGIMTFWESQNNYGQLLQAYALQTYLQKEGHEVFFIRYKRIPPNINKTFFQKILNFDISKFISNKINRKKILFESSVKPRKFDEFKKHYLKFSEDVYINFDELKSNPPIADVYICGSDQVWNNTFQVSCEAFLLGFGEPSVKRIAYAASFGVKNLSAETHDLFKKYISDFKGISIREKSGVEICNSLGVKDAQWVPDPTLLFNKYDWIKMLALKDDGDKKGKQIFIYTLGNSEIKDKQKFISYVNSLKDVNVVHTTANGDFSGDAYPTINEWVNIIKNSDLVITTSFHGMVFCIIFNRNFIVLPNTGSAEGMNERIDSLLGRLGLNDHVMEEFNEVLINKILNKQVNWEIVNKELLAWRSEADRFIEASLQS